MLSYMERQKQAMERDFIRDASVAIQDGKGYHEFCGTKPQYDTVDRSTFCRLYVEMQSRYKNAKQSRTPWTVAGELELSDQRWRDMVLKRNEDAIYQENRQELLSLASEGAGWQEAKRRLGWTDDLERNFRRAQQEAGVSRRNERQDPMDAAFASGFFSE